MLWHSNVHAVLLICPLSLQGQKGETCQLSDNDTLGEIDSTIRYMIVFTYYQIHCIALHILKSSKGF